MASQHILSLETNQQGRDFVVGDIHGMFTALDNLLKKVKFNPEIDRIISVGDLVDRGAESHRVLEYLEQPWFFAIMGNHEEMCLESATSPSTYKNWVKHNGGAWWESIDEPKQQAIREAFSALPTIAEIPTNNGLIGVVHADITARIGWNRFKETIAEDESLRHFAIWSRARYDRYHAVGSTENIQGVKLVIVGHTPTSKTLDVGNVRYIDTGAPYINAKDLGKLTMMQVQPSIKLFQQKTKKKSIWGFA